MAADGGMGQKLKMFKLLALVLLFGMSQGVEKKHGGVCDKIPQRKIDTAYVTVDAEGIRDVNLTLKGVSSECHTCRLQTMAVIHNGSRCTVLVDTRWHMRLAIATDDTYTQLVGCGESVLSGTFLDRGNYTIYVKDESDTTSSKLACKRPLLMNNPYDSNIPIYVAIGSIVAAALLWMLGKRLMRSHFIYRVMYRLSPRSGSFLDPTAYTAQDLGMPTTGVAGDSGGRPQQQKERLKSLDTFRGISIVLMIFVNYRGGDYWFFRHSKWNGLTVADLVFPWFVWIMGTAMAYSFQSLLRKATPKSLIFWKIFKRSCILFALGLLINSSDGLNPVRMREFRIPGVLQRFAGTYLIIATMHLMFAKQSIPHQFTWWTCIQDIVIYWQEWLFNFILVFVWLMVTFLMEIPGCPKGYLGPGGLANDDPNHHNVTDCTGGAASYIDRKIFGEGRIYQTPTCKEIYHSTVPHDPEGLLGTLTSCFMCFLGLQAGKILLTFHDWRARVKRFVIWGICLGIVALILCEGKKDGGFIPINKNLWSLSFVICLSSFAFFLFTFCYITIDVYKIWTGAPFYYPGMNAIVLYMGHEIINQPFKTFWGIKPNSHAVYLGINSWDTAVWILLSYFLYHHDIFISI